MNVDFPAQCALPEPASHAVPVEVVLCTYNGEVFVREQLESILSQRTLPDLISIWDDRSTDRTIEIVDDVRRQCPHQQIEIRVTVHPMNMGWMNNFANAVAKSRGEVLFLCDQDDLWHEDKVGACLELLEHTNADMVFTDGEIIDSKGRKISEKSVLQNYGLENRDIHSFHRRTAEFLARRNVINGAALAVKGSAARAALPVPSGVPHDYWLAVWCAVHGGIASSPLCLYQYRQHERNVIGAGLNFGFRSWYYQWASMINRPQPPRERELRILDAIVERIADFPGSNAAPFMEKHRWLTDCVAQQKKIPRLTSIMASAISGKYRRFGTPYSLTRDLLSIVR